MHNIYLDHAATTPVDPQVLDAMLPYFTEKYGNAESANGKGHEAKIAIDQARTTIAKHLNCNSNEIVFTGSGSEANNLALFGIARAHKASGTHIITSQIEHSSVLEPCKKLEKEGFEVTYIEPDQDGIIDPEKIAQAITPQTRLVSIIYANNEVGTIQKIREIGTICRSHKILFHTDACQAAGALSLDTQDLQVDLLTINGSKIYGPKGIGALFIKRGTKIEPIIFGGGQEFNLRAGTHNTPSIIGLAKALEIAQSDQAKENTRLIKLRDRLITQILTKIPDSILNGHALDRLPNNINVSFNDIVAQELIMHLSEVGIYASSGSACEESSGKESQVLKALKVPDSYRHGTLRLSLGKSTTQQDLDFTIDQLTSLIPRLRQNRRR